MGKLSGKTALVTGGSRGIGAAAVRALAKEGAHVIIHYGTRAAEADALAREIKGLGGKADVVGAELAAPDAALSLAKQVKEITNSLDILVLNAGTGVAAPIEDITVAQFDRLFAVNVRALFIGARHAIPHLKKSGRGSIINTASLAGKRGGPGLTAYAASKGAVIAFTTTLALELAPERIRVNAICPGWVDTAFNQPIIDFMGGPDAQAAKVSAMVPLGRQGQPHEIAPLFVFLASDESSYVTAQSILADGGAFNG